VHPTNTIVIDYSLIEDMRVPHLLRRRHRQRRREGRRERVRLHKGKRNHHNAYPKVLADPVTAQYRSGRQLET
jgi:hypothetical protein